MKTPSIFSPVTAVLLLLSLTGQSQNDLVEVTTVINKDQSVSFNYKKKGFGSFYLTLTFMYLENSFPASFKGNIESNQGNLFTLRPTSSLRSIGYSYKYSATRGKFNSRIDSGFVYLLPVSKGETVTLYKQVIVNDEFSGATEPENMISFIFKVKPGDTVFSARKGLVVDVFDESTSTLPISVSKNMDPNSILIEHEDGTLARYFMLEKSSVWVKPGQVVFPHTPLALAGTLSAGNNAAIGIQVYYLSKVPLGKPDNSTQITNNNGYTFLNLLFHTAEGDVHIKEFQNYTADFSPEQLTKELDKKELKKLGKFF